MTGDAEAVARDFVAACNAEDGERLLELLHPDVELHEAKALPGAVSAVGLDAVRHYLERFATHWRSFSWEPLEWAVDGERVMMRARLSLEGRESGIAVAREWWYVFTIRDGRLYRQDGYDDRESATQALAGRR